MPHPSPRPLLLVAIALLAALLVAACGSPSPTPTPEPLLPTRAPAVVPTEAPTVVPPTPVPDLWQQIQQDGKMTVGVSADYPPFEFYDDELQLDGFDIALMQAIGQKLGVDVEFVDRAFDGLLGSLALGNIDAAISAITVTPARAEQVDFTASYYIGVGAALAADTWQQGQITTPEELGPLRIGVQDGSIYESFAKNELIDQGILPEANLHVYRDIADAVADVDAGRIEVAFLDLDVARTFADQGGVEVVGESVQEQDYAIAVPLNQSALRHVLDRALDDLIEEGVIDELAVTYLGVDPDNLVPLPTATPAPTAAPNQPTPTPVPTKAPPAGCLPDMEWVADLSYPDGTIVPPGQSFVKGWRVRNIGSCTWNSAYILSFVDGNVAAAAMGGQPVAVQGQVAPEATYDFAVGLVAPTAPGTYKAWWQLHDGQGKGFGQKLWVQIVVPQPTQPTPVPTQTPVPGISFSANPTNIQQGQCSTVRWSTSNVRDVYYYQEGQNWQDHGVPSPSSRTECPSQTTNYYLRVVMNDNSVQTRQVTIYVTPVVGAPTISRFDMSPPSPIVQGQCVSLQWNVEGSVSKVTLSRNNGVIWDNAPFQGSYPQDCPGAGQYTYQLVATGPGGQSQATQYLQVNATPPTATPTDTPPPPPTDTPTPVPPPPTDTPTPVPQPEIYGFSVQPPQIVEGDCFTVEWNTGGGTVSVNISRNADLIVVNGPPSGSQPDCPAATMPGGGQFTYTLVASNAAGTTISQSTMVSMMAGLPPTPEPPPIDTPVPPEGGG